MNKFLISISLNIGIVTFLGVSAPVYAIDSSNTTIKSDVPKNGQVIDVCIPGKSDPIPADGDIKGLNVGWSNIQGTYYYCKDENRVKVTNWQEIDGKWFYLDPTTYSMQTGWLQDGGSWYYLTEPELLTRGKVSPKYGLGSMKTGWLQINGTWYYFNSNGSMKTGWLNEGGVWYYLTDATKVNPKSIDIQHGLGGLKIGWFKDGDKIYYFNEDGSMKTGWIEFDKKWYYLYSDGTIAKNTTIDGYELNSNGEWISHEVNTDTKITNENFEFDKATGTIKEYKGTDRNVIIPNEINGTKVTSIGSWAFQKCKDLTSITIPNSVTNIGDYAFWKCENLISINIPDGVKRIEAGTFEECTSLASIIIPSNVTSIGSSAFYGCSRLTNITIGDSVTNIDAWAFKNISKNSVYYLKSEEIKKLLTNSGSDIIRTEVKS